MAIMVPANPQLDKKAHEDVIFNALKRLPDDWFVLYSFKIFDPGHNNYNNSSESETDFIVLIPDVGAVVIEAKSGIVQFKTESFTYKGKQYPPYSWVYESGVPMKHGGPFRQARDEVHNLRTFMENRGFFWASYRMRIFSAVWFMSINDKQANALKCTSDGPRETILTFDALSEPRAAILKVVDFEAKMEKRYFNEEKERLYGGGALSRKELSSLINDCLYTGLNIIPTKHWLIDVENMQLNALLEGQTHIIDYLEDQPTAVISGVAGSGKTLVAVEKARRESLKGHKVLFLCFNSKLRDHLADAYKYPGIDFFTIDGFACKVCKTSISDLVLLVDRLQEPDFIDEFPYQAVIIDEAQDFGQERAEETGIIRLLGDCMCLKDGCFYLFYDKYQVIQSSELPSYIKDADCKLTLYKNCRNTKKIAETSVSPLSIIPKMMQGLESGSTPVLYLKPKDQTKTTIDSIIDGYRLKGITDIAILTVKTLASSSLAPFANGENYLCHGTKCLFTTARKFKGLEAEAVILIDVSEETFFNGKNSLLFYVGTSRAKFVLSVVASIENDLLKTIAQKIAKGKSFDGLPDSVALALSLNMLPSEYLDSDQTA